MLANTDGIKCLSLLFVWDAQIKKKDSKVMKAIETEYNNYKFRSRLKARWAVFFDALGIEYEYENEGYDLDGVGYLPDFWLPRLDLWVEIKGERLVAGSKDEEKIKRLVKDSRRPVAVFWGQIHTTVNLPDLYTLPDWDTMKVCEALVIDRSSSWTECPMCHMVGLARYASPSLLPCGCCKDADKTPSITAAYIDVRKARFEYEDAKPKQKIKTSPNLVQKQQEESIQHKQVRTKNPSPLPGWDDSDDLPFLDEPNGTANMSQQRNSVASLSDRNDGLQSNESYWGEVSQPAPILTIEEVKELWHYVMRRVKCKKDGAKVAALLGGYTIISIEGTQGLPVIVLQAKVDFYYSALSSRADCLTALEWAIKVELKQECKIQLIKPQKLEKLQFKDNDLIRYNMFGKGIILKSQLEGNTEFVEVLFDGKHGRKRLSMDFAKLEKLSDVEELEDDPF